MRSLRVQGLGILLGFGVLVVSRGARGDVNDSAVKLECVAAAERVQQLREEHKLLQARSVTQSCAREACPAIIQRDCAAAFNELVNIQPSIVVRAKSGGADRVDVRVLVDGVEMGKRLEGTPIEIDPGIRVLRLEATGATPWEQQLVVVEGERRRVIDVVLEPLAAETRMPAPPQAIEPAAERGRGIPVGAFVLGGVGAVGLAGFAYFGLGAQSGIDTLRSSCAPYCSEDEIADVQTKRIAADVSLGAGIVALGIATWLVLRPTDPPPRATARSFALDGRAVAGGGMAVAEARFQ